MWLESREQPFVLAVKSNEPLWVQTDRGPSQVPAARVAAGIAEEGWERLSAGVGGQGAETVRLGHAAAGATPGTGVGPLAAGAASITDPTELAYYVVFGLAETTLQELTLVAGRRLAIEESIERAKGEAGLDEYEVRHWEGWYRHIILSLLALAFLVATRAEAAAEAEKGGPRAA